MKTYELRTNNGDFGLQTEAAFDYTPIKNQGGLPNVGDLLSVTRFERGVGFRGTVTVQVNTKPFFDDRAEKEIRSNPHNTGQVTHGHDGYKIHRVVFPSISKY